VARKLSCKRRAARAGGRASDLCTSSARSEPLVAPLITGQLFSSWEKFEQIAHHALQPFAVPAAGARSPVGGRLGLAAGCPDNKQ